INILPAVILGKTIERTGERKGLERLLVDRPRAESLCKIKNVSVIPMRVAFNDDRLHSGIAGTFYGTQSEANGAVLVHLEINAGFIDVRPQHFNTHLSTFFN